MNKIIDISHHQGNIDWSQAAKEVSLAIIRTQYGTSTIDRKYKQNIEGCRKNGIPFGVYIYVTYKNKSQALAQAQDFYNRVKSYNPLFYVVDVEEQFCSGISELVTSTQTFIDYLKDRNVKVGLYCGHHFYNPYKMNTIKNYDFLWIPRYSGTSDKGKKPDFPCDLWQYTDKGKVSGINGSVDLNILNGNKNIDWFTNTIDKVSGLDMANAEELQKQIDDLKKSVAFLSSKSEVDETHKEAWKWAVENELIGKGPNPNPSGALTRQQFTTILKRYHELFIANNGKVSDTHQEKWNELIEIGITDGSNPRSLATREQVGTMLHRVINLNK